jgi:hypothetical protein
VEQEGGGGGKKLGWGGDEGGEDGDTRDGRQRG